MKRTNFILGCILIFMYAIISCGGKYEFSYAKGAATEKELIEEYSVAIGSCSNGYFIIENQDKLDEYVESCRRF